MDIQALGEKTLALFMERLEVAAPSDMYRLTASQILSLEGFQEKSVNNILDGLEQSKQVPFERVLFALGIRHVGETVAKTLARHFGSLEALSQASKEELLAVDEIGEVIADSIQLYFADTENRAEIEALDGVGLQFQMDPSAMIVQQGPLSGKQVVNRPENIRLTSVVSGTFTEWSRDEVTRLVESLGGKSVGSVSSKTDLVLAGEAMGPAKRAKAESLGIQILSEAEFKKIYLG